MQFFGKDGIDRYASEENMNFSLLFSTLWEICLINFCLPFNFVSRLKIFALDQNIRSNFFFIKADPIIYRSDKCSCIVFEHLSFFPASTNPNQVLVVLDITIHLANEILYRK